MDSKQSLAKIGVFVLLGVNVGAYYYFWPRQDGAPRAVAKAALQEKGEAQLLPPTTHPSVPAEPMHLPAETLHGAVPLAIANSPAVVEKKDDATNAILKLLEHIDKAKSPDLPMLPPAEPAKREEPERLDTSLIPIRPPENQLPATDAGIAVASPLTPKTPPGLWLLQTDKIGKRTQLTARLRDAATERVIGEFRILCDRVETNPQSGAVQALGNVTFRGAGWRGTCQAVTLPVHEPRLVFEQQVQILQDILGTSQDGALRGERIVWELPAPATAGVSGVTLPLSR
jgi:hypothetical protein